MALDFEEYRLFKCKQEDFTIECNMNRVPKLGNKNVERLFDQRRTRFPLMIRHIKSCRPSNSRYNFLMAVHLWQLMGISISSTVNLLWSGDESEHYLLAKSRFGNIFLSTTATSPVGTRCAI